MLMKFINHWEKINIKKMPEPVKNKQTKSSGSSQLWIKKGRNSFIQTTDNTLDYLSFFVQLFPR